MSAAESEAPAVGTGTMWLRESRRVILKHWRRHRPLCQPAYMQSSWWPPSATLCLDSFCNLAARQDVTKTTTFSCGSPDERRLLVVLCTAFRHNCHWPGHPTKSVRARSVMVCPSVRLSVRRHTHRDSPGAACDAASIDFGPTIWRTDILVRTLNCPVLYTQYTSTLAENYVPCSKRKYQVVLMQVKHGRQCVSVSGITVVMYRVISHCGWRFLSFAPSPPRRSIRFLPVYGSSVTRAAALQRVRNNIFLI